MTLITDKTTAASCNKQITGKHVVVTGAGGSIGSELVRQVASMNPASLLIVDHSEIGLYDVMQSLAGMHITFEVVPALVDIRDTDAVTGLLNRPFDTLLHAAAYKHVPMLETAENAIEGLRVNVGGTFNLLHCAAKAGAYMLLISSDKAAAPASFMGLTKRLAELVLIAFAESSGVPADYVRFGNVLGSSGSVVPLFQKQIAAGGPVTVTHPDMTRFFMSISQAVSLVLSVASNKGLGEKRTELHVLDMGKPRRILDLAEDLISQAGFRPGVDIKIEFTGIRPGEKLEEVLEYGAEKLKPSGIAGVSSYRPPAIGKPPLFELVDAIRCRDRDTVSKLIARLVPEYTGADPWWPLDV